MRKMVLMVLIIVGCSLIAEAALAGRVDRRQAVQNERIEQGVHRCTLTAGEAIRLEREQARIRKAKRRAWRDGALTGDEQLRLERQQDHASRSIYRYHHND
jgi:hypothetical protein